MAKQKPAAATDANDPALAQRVDAMMDPLAAPPPPRPAEIPAAQPGSIDIFKELKSAPQLPGDLLKQANFGVRTAAKPVNDGQLLKTPEPIPQLITSKPTPVAITPITETEQPVVTSDDPATDKAVDDIMARESDTVLEAQDALAGRNNAVGKRRASTENKFKRLLKSKRLWAAIILVLIAVFAVPFSRNALLGSVIKLPVTIQVMDSTTHTPVSGAVLRIGSTSTKTDGHGQAVLNAPFGNDTVSVTKQYYTSYVHVVSVGFAKRAVAVSLVATGRQVPVSVVNTLTGKPVSGAEIKILDTTARTDLKGNAVIVLPTKSLSSSATVSAIGFNTAQAMVAVTSSVVAGNTIQLTPAGFVYYLSNKSGKFDVVKANLDGTDRQTVLAGTGSEDPTTTTLLPSHDWKYVALRSHRDGTEAALYLIDTSTDKVTEFDTSDADFSLVGWSGHTFVYDLVRHTVTTAQTGHESLKSYNAETSQLNQLDQNQAEGDATSYAYQTFTNFSVASGVVVYTVQWQTYSASGTAYDDSSQVDSIRGVQASGSSKKDYQTFPAPSVTSITMAHVQPQVVNFELSATDGTKSYYQYQNQVVTTPTGVTDADFAKSYPVYLVSPNGSQTFWSQTTAGTNSLYTGNANAQTAKLLPTASNFSAYGWYSDDYILVSKGGSQLYAASPAQLASGHLAVPIDSYTESSSTASVPDYASQ